MLHPRVEAALGEVIDAWLTYDDARKRGAALPVLVEVRMRLEDLRERMHGLRRSHHPSQEEMGEMAFAAYCGVLAATVFIPYRAVTGDRYRCSCGESAEVPG